MIPGKGFAAGVAWTAAARSAREVPAPHREQPPEQAGREAERDEHQARGCGQEAHREDAEERVLRRGDPREDRARDYPQDRERDEGAQQPLHEAAEEERAADENLGRADEPQDLDLVPVEQDREPHDVRDRERRPEREEDREDESRCLLYTSDAADE